MFIRTPRYVRGECYFTRTPSDSVILQIENWKIGFFFYINIVFENLFAKIVFLDKMLVALLALFYPKEFLVQNVNNQKRIENIF